MPSSWIGVVTTEASDVSGVKPGSLFFTSAISNPSALGFLPLYIVIAAAVATAMPSRTRLAHAGFAAHVLMATANGSKLFSTAVFADVEAESTLFVSRPDVAPAIFAISAEFSGLKTAKNAASQVDSATTAPSAAEAASLPDTRAVAPPKAACSALCSGYDMSWFRYACPKWDAPVACSCVPTLITKTINSVSNLRMII